MEDEQLYFFGLKKNATSQKKRLKIILPLDTLILLSIVFIILSVVFFSLGVENGKKIALHTNKSIATTTTNNIQNSKKSSPELSKQQSNLKQPEKKVDKKNTEKINDSYHIQIASFHKENAAQKEAANLKKTGYPVLIRKSGKYVVVYVGGFSNKGEATKRMECLKKKYKDCILRRL